jgi:hypothetical protein
MTPGSPNFPSNDLNEPARTGEANGTAETQEGKAEQIPRPDVSQRKIPSFWGKNPWI